MHAHHYEYIFISFILFQIDENRSIVDKRTPLHVAAEQNNIEAIKLIIQDMYMTDNKRHKTGDVPVLLSSIDTGRYCINGGGGGGVHIYTVLPRFIANFCWVAI